MLHSIKIYDNDKFNRDLTHSKESKLLQANDINSVNIEMSNGQATGQYMNQ